MKRPDFFETDVLKKIVAASALSAVALSSCGGDSRSYAHRESATQQTVAGIVPGESRDLQFEAFPGMSQLSNEWETIMSHREGKIDVAVMDINSGQVAQSRNTDERFYTASIIKLSILVELLRQYQDKGMAVDECEQRAAAMLAQCQSLDLAYPMITRSDNATASQLFATVGGVSGMQQFYDRIGAGGTTVSSSWGVTETTAVDQLKVVQAAITPDYVLSRASVGVARNLMRQVVPDQQWGVGDGTPIRGADFENKNGWIPDLNTTYNSIGYIYNQDGSIRYMMAILTKDSPSELHAKETMRLLSGSAYHVLSAE